VVIFGHYMLQIIYAMSLTKHKMQTAQNFFRLKMTTSIDVSTAQTLQTIPPDLLGQISKAPPPQIGKWTTQRQATPVLSPSINLCTRILAI
jgi:hypothetical protein